MKKLLLMMCLMLVTAGLTSPARAIDFDQKIVNLDGSEPKDEKGQLLNLTVGTVCVNALMTPMQEDSNDSGEDKIKRGVLAERIFKREDYKFSVEELAVIKKRVNKTNPSPLIVRQTWEALEKK